MKFANNHLLEKLQLIKEAPSKKKKKAKATTIEYTEFQELSAFQGIYTDASNRLRDTPYALQKRLYTTRQPYGKSCTRFCLFS